MIKYISKHDKNFYVTDEISSVATTEANLNWENRYKFVSDLAAISRGKYESTNPEKRFKHLLKEASTDVDKETISNSSHMENLKNENRIKVASRPLEFLPVALTMDYADKYFISAAKEDYSKYSFYRHCFVDKNDVIYTNFRHLYNWLFKNTNMSVGSILDIIPFNTKDELRNFKAIRLSTPMFVWAQLMTHTQISKESQSDRVSYNDKYWLPDDIVDKLLDIVPEENKDTGDIVDQDLDELQFQLFELQKENVDIALVHKYLINVFLYVLPQDKVQDILEKAGYNKEIYSRAPYYFKYKEMVMTGWANDPEVWGHLLLEREAYDNYHKSWVQKETADTAKAIRDIIMGV